MSYQILSHTADLKMKVAGKSLDHLFYEAMRAMMDYMKPSEGFDPAKTKRRVSITAAEPTILLIDFLSEILTSAQTNKEIYTKLVFIKFGDSALVAELEGQKVTGFKKDIKAATFHEAEIKKNEKGEWETLLVYDI